MAGRRFPQSLGTSSGIRWRATAIVLGAIVLAVLLAWGQAGGGSPAAADDMSIPAAGLDFSIGIDTDGDTTDDCSSSGNPTDACAFEAGEIFSVSFYLNSLPNKIDGYDAIQIILEHAGVGWMWSREWVWPEGFCLSMPEPGWYPEGLAVLGCSTMGTSAYTGLMVTTDFMCSESGTVTMMHGRVDTTLWAAPGGAYAEGDGTIEALTVICGEPPTATPTPTSEPTVTPTPTWPPIPAYGDVNCDGRVDSVDPLLILQYHAALIDSLPCPEGADVNEDGRVDSMDAWWILQALIWTRPLLPLPPDNTQV